MLGGAKAVRHVQAGRLQMMQATPGERVDQGGAAGSRSSGRVETLQVAGIRQAFEAGTRVGEGAGAVVEAEHLADGEEVVAMDRAEEQIVRARHDDWRRPPVMRTLGIAYVHGGYRTPSLDKCQLL